MVQFENTGKNLRQIIEKNVSPEVMQWLHEKLDIIINENATRELYLTYSLIASKMDKSIAEIGIDDRELADFLKIQQANIQQLGRIYLLQAVLEKDPAFFESKVAGIIQVADTGELETFLKFLILLPNAKHYKTVAVDALRTNIATIFDAIALNNPYPGCYFEPQEWNQMFLKAAFMERDLHQIQDIDRMANAELARIVSDYAHERWAASRVVAPHFWRPVIHFMDDIRIGDMERLLQSDRPCDREAAALCCYESGNTNALQLLESHPELKMAVAEKKIDWNNLNIAY
ncbi:EboA domain-containing protein [Spongiimicrobium salis]|uniref:EboA domain-containing protein n=1 Tax=Spongiimicrobium salis TaxID=1667022 RepID=UPI00374CA044